MDEVKAPAAVDEAIARQKVYFWRNVNAVICLAVVAALVWVVFVWEARSCRACNGNGSITISKERFFGLKKDVNLMVCGYCDGDGKVSLWKGR